MENNISHRLLNLKEEKKIVDMWEAWNILVQRTLPGVNEQRIVSDGPELLGFSSSSSSSD